MANDFFDKYKAKGSDDLDNIAQQVPSITPEPVASGVQGEPTTFAETAQDTPAAAQSTAAAAPSMRFEQDKNNGFTMASKPAASRTAAHAAAKPQVKTIAGVPVQYIGIAVAVVVAILLAFWLFGRGKVLPDLQGRSASEAELWANENNVMLRAEELYSDEVKKGSIISQSPAAGERISGSDFFTITVSSGPDLSVMVPVPDIKSMTMAEVQAWADENFMTTLRMTTQTSDTVPSGQVIEFTINDNTVLGDSVRRDTPFYVVFSKGKGVGEAVKVPNFLSMSVDEAKAFATENEINLVVEEEFSETVAKGNIIRQDVKAEETVYAGNTITIVVSTGEEVIVPNFGLLSRELAAAKASQLGIQTLVEETYSTLKKDALISQSVAAGTLYNEDDIIVLRYSLGNSFLINSFVGQNETDVYAWRDALNEKGAAIQVTVTYTESASAFGTVLDQSHEGVAIGIDEHIYIIVSGGIPVIMPNFVQSEGAGYGNIITKADVIAACDELGIVAYFEEEAKSNRKPGEVWYQSVPAGQEILQGRPVVIKIVPESASVTVPNFVDLTVEQLEAHDQYKKLTFSFVNQKGDIVQNTDGYTIMTQSVASGSKVAEGYPITLTIKKEAVEPSDSGDTGNNTGGTESGTSETTVSDTTGGSEDATNPTLDTTEPTTDVSDTSTTGSEPVDTGATT